jgi:hypothetical protein
LDLRVLPEPIVLPTEKGLATFYSPVHSIHFKVYEEKYPRTVAI